MALPVTPPYAFGNVTSSIPLTNLDADFATIYAAVNGIGNGTVSLANVTITGGSIQNVAFTLDSINNTPIGNVTPSTAVVTSLTDSGLTSGRVTYAGTSGLLQDSANLTFNGTTLTLANDASISGLTVGKGGGAVSTNTVVGNGAFATNSSGTSNSAFGVSALAANTTGSDNSAFNQNALLSNTTGSDNTGLGVASLKFNTTGSNNTGIGSQALLNNTTASNNTAVGYQAGYSLTTSNQNAFFGYQSGYSQTTNNQSAYFGAYSGQNTTGQYNTFIGDSAGYLVTTGSKNTILGKFSGNSGGLNITTASNYIVFSDGDGNPRGWFDSSGTFNTSSLGAGYATRTNITANGGVGWNGVYTSSTGTPFYAYFVYNGSNVGNINGTSVATIYATTSDQRLKENIVDAPSALSKIDSIKIRSFDWINTKENVDFGVIAQELYQVAPNAVCVGIDHEDGTIDKPWGVDISFLVPALIKAVQELKAEVDALKASK